LIQIGLISLVAVLALGAWENPVLLVGHASLARMIVPAKES